MVIATVSRVFEPEARRTAGPAAPVFGGGPPHAPSAPPKSAARTGRSLGFKSIPEEERATLPFITGTPRVWQRAALLGRPARGISAGHERPRRAHPRTTPGREGRLALARDRRRAHPAPGARDLGGHRRQALR